MNAEYVQVNACQRRAPSRRTGRPIPEHSVVSEWIRTMREPTRIGVRSIIAMTFASGQRHVVTAPADADGNAAATVTAASTTQSRPAGTEVEAVNARPIEFIAVDQLRASQHGIGAKRSLLELTLRAHATDENKPALVAGRVAACPA